MIDPKRETEAQSSMSLHLERIEREAGVPNLTEILSENLTPTDLQSLLLEVYRRRSRKLSPSQILKRYKESRFCRPSHLAPLDLLDAQRRILQSLEGKFEALQLSPLYPLATCSAVATCDQNKIVSTVRNVEVAADPTNALALEAAVRRKKAEQVHLTTIQRVVRAQSIGNNPELYAHFGIWALLSSGLQGKRFLERHLRVILRFFQSCLPELAPLSLRLTPLDSRGEAEVEQVTPILHSLFPELEVMTDRERQSGRGYYVKTCFKLFHGEVDLGDGGYSDWTAKLTNNRKEACFVSGLGLERLVARLSKS